MNYQRNKKYFKESASPLLPIAIGLVGLGALGLGKGCAVFGLILIVVAGAMLYMNLGGRPGDAEIDADIASALQALTSRGLAKLGLDGDEVKVLAPVMFDGPESGPVGNSHPSFKLGKDNRLRSSNWEAVVLFFSEAQVYSYTYKFSLTEQSQMELTNEYFYKDIVSVATGSENFQWQAGKQSKSMQLETFKLTVSGDALEVALANNTVAAQSVQGMKQLIREKKNA